MRRPVLAISIGDAADLERLGFPRREVRRVLFSVCTTFIRSGYDIAYAGDLRADGFTMEIFEFLAGTYAGQGVAPFIHVVPSMVSERLGFDEILSLVRKVRSIAALHFVRGDTAFEIRNSENSLIVGPKGPARFTIDDQQQWREFLSNHPFVSVSAALTEARRHISQIASGCLSMGGKMGLSGMPGDQFEGQLPGVAEEALLFLKLGKPFVPLAAFGGATRDIAIALNLLDKNLRTPRTEQAMGYNESMQEIASFAHTLAPGIREKLMRVSIEERAEEAAQAALALLQNFPNADYKISK